MANTKIELSKKDMNFFSEFSGSSSQVNAIVPYALLILVALVVVGGVVFGFLKIQTAAVRSQIDILNAEINSEENQKNLKEYTDTYNSLAGYNLQYYDVSSLFSNVKNTDKIDSAVMDAVYANLPVDVFISDLSYESGKVQLTGTCDSYFTPLSMLANFREVSLFSNIEILSIEQIDFSTSPMPPEEIAAASKFSFDIVCYLKDTYPVVTSRLIDDTASTPLTAVYSQTLGLGEKYEIKNINTYTSENGTVYTVSRILVNNIVLTEQQLATVKQNDLITGITNAATDIKIYYVADGGAQS